MSAEMGNGRLLAVVATALFATLPASILAVLAVAGIFAAMASVFAGDLSSFPLVIWFGGGVIGAGALWALFIPERGSGVIVGLIIGIVSFAPISVLLLSNMRYDSFPSHVTGEELLLIFLSLSIPVTAIAWIVYLSAKADKKEEERRA